MKQKYNYHTLFEGVSKANWEIRVPRSAKGYIETHQKDFAGTTGVIFDYQNNPYLMVSDGTLYAYDNDTDTYHLENSITRYLKSVIETYIVNFIGDSLAHISDDVVIVKNAPTAPKTYKFDFSNWLEN